MFYILLGILIGYFITRNLKGVAIGAVSGYVLSLISGLLFFVLISILLILGTVYLIKIVKEKS